MAGQKAKRFAVAAAVGATIVAGGVVSAGPASASGPGYCTSGNACMTYDSNNSGANYGLNANYSSYGNIMFGCTAVSCDGSGVGVWNGAASADNFRSGYNLCIYFHTSWWGPKDVFAPYGNSGYAGNLNNTYKNNASNLWAC